MSWVWWVLWVSLLEELDNANSIPSFNWFKVEVNVECFRYHFRPVDVKRYALYVLGVPVIYD